MRKLISWFVLSLFATSAWAAETAPATKPAPKADKKTADKYKEADTKSGIYIEPGVSALVFNGPERPTPIVSQSPATFQRLLRPSEEETVTPAYRLAVGYVFKDMPSWLGKNFRVEGSGDFWFAEAKSRQAIPHVPTAFAKLYDFSVPTNATDFANAGLDTRLCSILRTSDNQYFDANLIAKTDYRLSHLISVSPSLGFTYATLDHDAKVVSRGGVEIYRMKEHLNSEFYGGTVGLDVNFKPFEKFTFTAGGSVSPMASTTNGTVTNSWEPNGFPGGGSQYKFAADDDQFTFRATGTGSVKYQALPWFAVTAYGGVEYWDKIAVVDYPHPPFGVDPEGPNTGFPKIGYNSMTNFRFGLNFTFTIGK